MYEANHYDIENIENRLAHADSVEIPRDVALHLIHLWHTAYPRPDNTYVSTQDD